MLGVAALDGLLMGLKYFIVRAAAMAWVTRLRKAAFARVMRQDKKTGTTRASCSRASRGSSSFSVGLVWALLKGWQLAFVGFVIVPVFAAAMAAQTGFVARCEMRNKRAREEVAMRYYETISNIRGIRSMRFEGVFQSQFDKATDRALAVARKGAIVEECTYGVACGLIYLAEVLLFHFGAVLVARGTYTYLQMVQVMNLVVFTVTIGSQLMAFTQHIAESLQVTRDFSEFLRLPTRTDESNGFLRPRLDHLSQPRVGECVAIVGASGSGKSTLAVLLQRLYEPTFGAISIGLDNLRSTDVAHLRQQVSIVSQQPTLFDVTISENISYRSDSLSHADVRRAAEATANTKLSLAKRRFNSYTLFAALVSVHSDDKIVFASDGMTPALSGTATSVTLDKSFDLQPLEIHP
ncbi:ABC transporter type 1, transmembrane domain-containing protein [Mycena rosella]|uniref:ABC transporter type 1, transmembrane domain-containing protein n=1 Tax=Mycena rosella TaxID=1033263 RepID=A0AAD7CX11_MYCRO|nr:ABC transporter type 1, transmembrane domain-containing protein [Mycena rosella]